MNNWIVPILALTTIGSLAAVFVLWAKVDEQKQQTADEHANYIAVRGLHNTVCAFADKQSAEIENLEHDLRDAQGTICLMESDLERLINDRVALKQDLKSATLCPHNNHVWKDGRCVKCGRVKDAAD